MDDIKQSYSAMSKIASIYHSNYSLLDIKDTLFYGKVDINDVRYKYNDFNMKKYIVDLFGLEIEEKMEPAFIIPYIGKWMPKDKMDRYIALQIVIDNFRLIISRSNNEALLQIICNNAYLKKLYNKYYC